MASNDNRDVLPPSTSVSSTSVGGGVAGGGGGGGGLSHSTPLRTIPTSPSGIAAVHGPGLQTAVTTTVRGLPATMATPQSGYGVSVGGVGTAGAAPPVFHAAPQPPPSHPGQVQQQQQQTGQYLPVVRGVDVVPPTTHQTSVQQPPQRQQQQRYTQQPPVQQQHLPTPPAIRHPLGGETGASATTATRTPVTITGGSAAPPPSTPPRQQQSQQASATASATAGLPSGVQSPSSSSAAAPRGKTKSNATVVARTNTTTTTTPASTTPVTIPPTSTPGSAGSASGGPSSSLELEADVFLSSSLTDGVSPRLRPSPLPDDETPVKRVKTLAGRRAWGDVLQVSGEVLNSSTSPHQPFHSALINESASGFPSQNSNDPVLTRLERETSETLALRFHAMLKLRRYPDLGREVERLNLLGDMEETAKGGKGSLPGWVPWGLRILAAETLQYTDKPQRCTDRLHRIRERLAMSSSESDKAWVVKVDNALANTFVRQREWRLALSAYDDLIGSLPRAVAADVDSRLGKTFHVQHGHDEVEVEALGGGSPSKQSNAARQWSTETLLGSSRVEILSRQGRVLLQVGALPEAASIFEMAKGELSSALKAVASAKVSQSSGSGELLTELLNSTIVRQAPAQILVNEGLLLFADDEYDGAMEKFSEAMELQRTVHNAVGETGATPPDDGILSPTIGVDGPNTLITQCLNNMALCALYSCQMHKAVEMMESLVREDPTLFLTEGLAFNLCTLYELGSDNATSGRKKRVLQLIAKRFFLHDIGPESFRIS